MISDENIILSTKKWVTEVVVGCVFCPFAAREVKKESIHYEVVHKDEIESCLLSIIQECVRLDENEQIETTLIIFPHQFSDFEEYLDFAELAEELMIDEGYEGIYQIASFHPDYLFADSEEEDPANYTNRSIYPMLHLLREESIETALENYENPEEIPERNVRFAREKGLIYMENLRNACK